LLPVTTISHLLRRWTTRLFRQELIVTFFLASTLFVAWPLYGWETDVHYALTRWLAIKAGFSEADAELIASGDQELDDGTYSPAPWAVGLHIALTKDKSASKATQRNHFPSYADVPDTPEKRAVEPNSKAAHEWALSEIDSKFGGDGRSRRRALQDFGNSLHPLQDSWSHQGVPDIPFRPVLKVWPSLGWGHPEKRAGWPFHDADLTFLHVNDAIATARETYSLLLKYLGAHKELKQREPIPWERLEPDVYDFARASTKELKYQWFNSDDSVPLNRYGRSSFLRELSLPGEQIYIKTSPLKPARHVVERDAIFQTGTSDVPVDVRETAERFLGAWILKANIEEALGFVDTEELQKQQLHQDLGGQEVLVWMRKFLTLWLIEDHGLVNEKGHGVPRTKGYSELPVSPAEATGPFRIVKYVKLFDAIESPDGKEPYWVGRVDKGTFDFPSEYALAFHFRSTTHDGLLILLGRDGNLNRWRVTGMFWIVT
jgi:hypothetical protein